MASSMRPEMKTSGLPLAVFVVASWGLLMVCTGLAAEQRTQGEGGRATSQQYDEQERTAPVQRNRDWLVRYVTQPIPDTPRNRRYLALIDRSLDDTHLGLDLEWLRSGGGDVYRSRWEINTIGCLAFCYRTKGLRYYQDPNVLAIVRAAMLAVVEHVTAEGKFIWPGDTDLYKKGSHEHAWRLEPLLLAYIWIGDKLPHDERATIEAALRRAADWLVAHPNAEANNRGAVWCAVTTLCGVYFNNQAYLDAAEEYADEVMSGVVLEDGEVGEHTLQYAGGGPDTGYTYTGWGYVYLYRLLSGKDELDDRLLQALRWIALYNTLSGWPNVAGASVRVGTPKPGIQDTLPAFEHFSRAEPFFATVADRYLARCETQGTGLFGGRAHVVSPFIWALFAAGVEAGSEPHPDWFVNHTHVYDRPNVHYALVSRAYQTGVTFRARAGVYRNIPPEGLHLRGMQTFAFGDEYPILFHTRHANSTTQADGIDTAITNVDDGPHGWEVLLTEGETLDRWRSELATIVARRKTLWTLYAYTPVSAVVVYGGTKGPITSRWAMGREVVPRPRLDAKARRISFAGLQGRLCFLTGDARLYKTAEGEDKRYVLEVVAQPPVSAFGFSNDSFGFEGLDAERQELFFSDASGRYRLSLKGVLGPDGNIDRAAPMRLAGADDG